MPSKEVDQDINWFYVTLGGWSLFDLITHLYMWKSIVQNCNIIDCSVLYFSVFAVSPGVYLRGCFFLGENTDSSSLYQ